MSIITDPTKHPQDRAIAVEPRPDLMEAAVADAAVFIAALLADPFDRDARTEARTWLTTWMAAHPGRRSTTTADASKGGA